MKPGDRVRLMHDNLEGIIVKVGHNIAEVEIEAGFIIPVAINEIVPIAKEEQHYFEKTDKYLSKGRNINKKSKAAKATNTDLSVLQAYRGIYIAFVAVNDRLFQLYLINATDWTLPYAVSKEQAGKHMGVSAGILRAHTYLPIEQLAANAFESWGTYYFQLIPFYEGHYTFVQPLVQQLHFRASSFFRSAQIAPLLEQKAYVFQLDKDFNYQSPTHKASVSIDTAQLSSKLLDKEKVAEDKIVLEAPSCEVDLHIEKLLPSHKGMDAGSIMSYQLEIFERKLDAAIACGMSEITFIHGVGSGRLRQAIHKRLSQHPQVAYFQDAKKEKFGYGATFVKLKN